MRHPAVHEAAVVAIPHPRWQERPFLILVSQQDAEILGQSILRVDHFQHGGFSCLIAQGGEPHVVGGQFGGQPVSDSISECAPVSASP